MVKTKYYVIKVGKKPGIYTNWDIANENVKGFKGAVFKSFDKLTEAKKYLSTDTEKKSKNDNIKVYVDGSFATIYGSGVYITDANGKELKCFSFSGNKEEFLTARNVAGECLSALKGISWAIENGHKEIDLIFDYIGIRQWLLGEWKTNTPIAKFYKNEFDTKYKNNIKINFIKVKSHTGNIGNEKADELAKKALIKKWKK
jgi:ribonuclease HI